MFWDVGKRHYNEEMVFYELLSRLDGEGRMDAPNTALQETSDLSNKPIDVDEFD
jgi:hypothetical protein